MESLMSLASRKLATTVAGIAGVLVLFIVAATQVPEVVNVGVVSLCVGVIGGLAGFNVFTQAQIDKIDR